MAYAGVFRRTPDGKVTLLTKDMTRPNGLAFSPDERTLYVAQSDETAALWRVFDVKPDGTIANRRVLLDVTSLTKTLTGLPDGMKLDSEGNLFATGPGGVLVITPRGSTSARFTPARQRELRIRRRRAHALHHRGHEPDARAAEGEGPRVLARADEAARERACRGVRGATPRGRY